MPCLRVDAHLYEIEYKLSQSVYVNKFKCRKGGFTLMTVMSKIMSGFLYSPL
jgi:hypothetical protein